MIRASVLKVRAAHGYAWLRDIGPYFNLDVQRLQLRPELIDVRSVSWCPLSHSDNEDPPTDGRHHFKAICQRLHGGRVVIGTGKILRIPDLDNFLTDHGFDIDPKYPIGTWGFYSAIVPWGYDRDWRILTQAWRDIVAANKPAPVDTAGSAASLGFGDPTAPKISSPS
jgi:hypothetical protein